MKQTPTQIFRTAEATYGYLKYLGTALILSLVVIASVATITG